MAAIVLQGGVKRLGALVHQRFQRGGAGGAGRGGWVAWVRYLVPRSAGADTELWAAGALGRRWAFTVCQPRLSIVTRMREGGLKREEGKQQMWGGGSCGGQTAQSVVV